MTYFDVIIATPGNNFTKNYVESILKTIEVLNKSNISWFWANAYNPHLGASREYVLIDNQIGTKINYNKIFWIDSDIFWKPKDFLKLYYSEKSIICGAYILNPQTTNTLYENFPISIMKDWEPVLNFNKYYRNKIKDLKNFKEFTEINETGFGFICIKKEVFDSFDGLYFCSINIEESHIFSEDSSWCYRAKSLGHKIYLDKNVLVGHSKNLSLEWENI